MGFTDLAQALKLATPSVWAPDPTSRTSAGQVADVATEDINALTVIKAFTLEERSAKRSNRNKDKNRRRNIRYYSEAPEVNNEASFHTLIQITRHHLDEQYRERLIQARIAFRVALAGLILGVALVFIGVGCIFAISLPVGVVTTTSSSISSIISALAFRFNKEANDRLDNIIKELSILDRASLAMHYIGYLSDTDKKDQAITDLIKQLYASSPGQINTKKS